MIIKPSVCTLGVAPHPRPDGVAPALDDDTPATRSVTELVYEVDSDNNWEATRRKLIVELAMMLTSLRNCYDPIPATAAVTGFYFPFRKRVCC